MMYGILFALLALCLACFREGVWTVYTAEDVARWQAEAAQAAQTPPRFQPAPSLPPAPARQGQHAQQVPWHPQVRQPLAEPLELVT